MIKTLKIRNFKSFPKNRSVDIDLSTDNKPIALFYGLNGAGKSAIGEVIDRNGNNREPLPDCEIETSGGLAYRYLIYNQDFVERAFRNANGFPGIFTIGEPQAEALRRREAIEAELPPLDVELEQLEGDTIALSEQSSQAEETLARSIWKSFQALKSTPLREFVRYGNDRAGFVNKVRLTQLSGTEPPSVSELIRRREELGDGQAQPKHVLRIETADLQKREADSIWITPIEGSSDSRLAPLIERLKNQDWVRHGGTYLDASEGHCPFCQQELPLNFEEELHALFDVTYQQKLAYLQSAGSNYEAAVVRFEDALDNIFRLEPFADEDASLQRVAGELRVAFAKNVEVVRSKVAAPGSVAPLQSTGDLLSALRDALSAVNERINTYNYRIDRRKEELVNIEEELWQRLAHDAASAIELFGEAETPRRTRMEAIVVRKRELTEHRRALQSELSSLHTGTASIDEAVAAINQRLSFLGMDGFFIRKDAHRDDLYQIARPEQEHGEFISLSEGEKTIITFLYFLELVKGSAEPAAALPPKRTIVVVDDPISSLSHNHVYDIATLIARDLVPLSERNPNGLRQLIILTHSLFFFHELIHGSYQLRKHMLFRRVIKRGETDVVSMGSNELGNDYEAFWQVIKDAQAADIRPPTLANAMPTSPRLE